ncbi:MAG: glycosyltransferase family 2 protein [Rhodocyclaceae bacterium]|nr:glycosyltransferase family 2 protein [Rhodocyclaceae bacterium]
MPLVDIAVIAYNQEEFIEECVESCLSQTMRDFRVTVFDDASSDDTEAICRELAEEDSRVRYVRNETNLGMVANACKAFVETDAPYFQLMLGDDVIFPNFLAELAGGLEKHPDCTFGYGLAHRIVGDGLSNGMYTFIPELPDGPNPLLPYLCFTNWIIYSFALIRREPMARLGHFDAHLRRDGRGFIDHYIFARLASLGPTYVSNKRLGYYRMHGSSSTSELQRDNRYKEEAIHVYDNIFHDLDIFDTRTRYMARANQIGRLLTANGIARTALDMLRAHEISSILTPIAPDFLQGIHDALRAFRFDSKSPETLNYRLETDENLAILAKQAAALRQLAGTSA